MYGELTRSWSAPAWPVGLAWFSPDCKHFSKAKGTKPVSKKIRGLAWVALRWMNTVKPRICMLENVEEFTTWGPLVERDGKQFPDPKRKGKTFKSFVREIKKAGYEVEYRILRACDYGDPTIRKRLFMIARCDGKPIVWPEPTHGDPKSAAVRSGKIKPWRTAAECIQWDIPAPSIFERKKPLAQATERRIFKGINRYVIDSADPFIVTYYGDKNGEFRGQSVDDPLATQTTENRHGLVVPYITECANASSPRVMPIDEPLRTILAETKGGHFALVSPHITKFHGDSAGSDIDKPMPTVTANSFKKRPGGAAPIGLVSAHMIPLTHQGGDRTNDLKEPFPTITAAHRGEIALAAATIVKNNHGDKPCQDVEEPLHTVTTQSNKHALVAAFMAKHYGGHETPGAQLDLPISTITTKDHHAYVAVNIVRNMGTSVGYSPDEPVRTVTQRDKDALVTSQLIKMKGTNIGQDVREPLQTITAGGFHFGEVRAFLTKYYGTDENTSVFDPLDTVTTKDRFGLVMVKGEQYLIVDIGMRMLMPRELFRAQGFYDSYIIDRDRHGKPFTKTAQVKMCGNSVCPGMAAALVDANVNMPERVVA